MHLVFLKRIQGCIECAWGSFELSLAVYVYLGVWYVNLCLFTCIEFSSSRILAFILLQRIHGCIECAWGSFEWILGCVPWAITQVDFGLLYVNISRFFALYLSSLCRRACLVRLPFFWRHTFFWVNWQSRFFAVCNGNSIRIPNRCNRVYVYKSVHAVRVHVYTTSYVYTLTKDVCVCTYIYITHMSYISWVGIRVVFKLVRVRTLKTSWYAKHWVHKLTWIFRYIFTWDTSSAGASEWFSVWFVL